MASKKVMNASVASRMSVPLGFEAGTDELRAGAVAAEEDAVTVVEGMPTRRRSVALGASSW